MTLLGCRAFPSLAPPSTCVLVWAEACFGLKMPSFPKRATAACGNHGRCGPEDNHTKAAPQEAGRCLPAEYTLLREGTPAPTGGFLCKASLASFPPRHLLSLGRLGPLALQSSIGPACGPGVSVTWNSFQTCFPVYRRLSWQHRAFFSQAGKSSTQPDRAMRA